MNNKKLKLKIVTPERLILEELVDQVTLPTTQGEITVLPNHIPLIASLASGDVVATVGGEQVPMAVVGGFIEVKSRRPKGSGIHDLRLQSGSGQDYITEVAILADFAEELKKPRGGPKKYARRSRTKRLWTSSISKPNLNAPSLASRLRTSGGLRSIANNSFYKNGSCKIDFLLEGYIL